MVQSFFRTLRIGITIVVCTWACMNVWQMGKQAWQKQLHKEPRQPYVSVGSFGNASSWQQVQTVLYQISEGVWAFLHYGA